MRLWLILGAAILALGAIIIASVLYLLGPSSPPPAPTPTKDPPKPSTVSGRNLQAGRGPVNLAEMSVGEMVHIGQEIANRNEALLRAAKAAVADPAVPDLWRRLLIDNAIEETQKLIADLQVCRTLGDVLPQTAIDPLGPFTRELLGGSAYIDMTPSTELKLTPVRFGVRTPGGSPIIASKPGEQPKPAPVVPPSTYHAPPATYLPYPLHAYQIVGNLNDAGFAILFADIEDWQHALGGASDNPAIIVIDMPAPPRPVLRTPWPGQFGGPFSKAEFRRFLSAVRRPNDPDWDFAGPTLKIIVMPNIRATSARAAIFEGHGNFTINSLDQGRFLKEFYTSFLAEARTLLELTGRYQLEGLYMRPASVVDADKERIGEVPQPVIERIRAANPDKPEEEIVALVVAEMKANPDPQRVRLHEQHQIHRQPAEGIKDYGFKQFRLATSRSALSALLGLEADNPPRRKQVFPRPSTALGECH